MTGMAAALLIGGGAFGCGKPVLRVADASLGDYYTEAEYKKLRREQREEYCRELAEQDSIYRDEIARARWAADRFTVMAAAARAADDSLSALADSLERGGRRAAPRATETGAPGAVTSVTVRAGDSLWRLSSRAALYGDGRRWPKLFGANRDRIRDADLIYPGQELRVPR